MKIYKLGTIGRAVSDYTGQQLIDLDAVADPNTPAFAVRAVVRNEHKQRTTLFFLIRVPLWKVTADDLEVVEFSTWPPEVKR